MLTHASNMAAILSLSCAPLVPFARKNRGASFQVLHRRIGAAPIGARQPIAAEHVTYWTNWGLYRRREP